jgi:serine protease AprX
METKQIPLGCQNSSIPLIVTGRGKVRGFKVERTVLFIFFGLFVFNAGLEASSAPVSAKLLEKLQAEGKADALLYFAPLDVLPEAMSRNSKAEKGRLVFERLRDHAAISQKEAVAHLQRKGLSFRSNYLGNFIWVEGLKQSDLKGIRSLPGLLRAEGNPVVSVQPLPKAVAAPKDSAPQGAVPGNISAIGADRVWQEFGVRGAGIVIAGQDTGYEWRHATLKRQYRGSLGLNVKHDFNWHNSIRSSLNGQEVSCESSRGRGPCDDTGHGTHTMGTMVGDDGGSNRIGVAPEAQWIGCRNMKDGVGTVATYMECFEFFLAPYPRGGVPSRDGRPDLAPHVTNNSWSCPPGEGCRGDEFLPAIRALRAAGIVTVVAAGNDGPNCGSLKDPPGSYGDELVSVAAMDHRNGKIADFSARGPSAFNGQVGISLSAPGEMVRSAIPRAVWPSNEPYESKSGTSMAAPHVAAVVALLWSAQPNLVGKVDETVALLQRTADGKAATQSCGDFPGSRIPNTSFGWGAVNAYRAVKAALGR